MSEDSPKSAGDIIGGLLNKVVESIVGPLIIALFLTVGVARSKHLDDPANWRVWVILVAIFLAVTLGGETLRRSLAKWRIPAASGQEIGLLVARLDGDKAGNPLRETVREAIKEDLGQAIEIILWPEALQLGEGRDSDTEIRVAAKAQKWLASKKCDLLLWGRVKGDRTLSLRFTPRSGTTTAAQSYGLTADTLDLPVKFLSDLGSAVAGRVVAAAAMTADKSGQYLVPILRATAARMEPLIKPLNPAFDADTRAFILYSYAFVRSMTADQTGANTDLDAALKAYRDALEQWTRERAPLKWAMTQSGLGNALQMLGNREGGTARLKEAIAAFRAALEEYTRARVPLEWAGTQNNLGGALLALGKRESGTDFLQEAVTAFRAALEEYTRARVPLEWAGTQNNLGNALRALGEREADTARLGDAIAAFRAALEEMKRERVPLDWAMTQSNLGAALLILGERENNMAQLAEAVAAFRHALEEYTRQRLPLRWAVIQDCLGSALRALGAHESGTEHLEAAIAAHRAALEERKREDVPLDWAATQSNLGNALQLLGTRESGTEHLEAAVAAYGAALEEGTRERVPLDWAATIGNRGLALMILAGRRSDAKMAQTGLEQIEIAFTANRDGGHARNAAFYQAMLPAAHALVAQLKEP